MTRTKRTHSFKADWEDVNEILDKIIPGKKSLHIKKAILFYNHGIQSTSGSSKPDLSHLKFFLEFFNKINLTKTQKAKITKDDKEVLDKIYDLVYPKKIPGEKNNVESN